jgi:hypothetical protein
VNISSLSILSNYVNYGCVNVITQFEHLELGVGRVPVSELVD